MESEMVVLYIQQKAKKETWKKENEIFLLKSKVLAAGGTNRVYLGHVDHSHYFMNILSITAILLTFTLESRKIEISYVGFEKMGGILLKKISKKYFIPWFFINHEQIFVFFY